MSTINDYTANKVRKSQNLRGLYDHARRIAKRSAIPLMLTVRKVEVSPLPHGGAHVTIYYADGNTWNTREAGDVGQVLFADKGIAQEWGKRFAARRGGTFYWNGE